MYQQLINCYQKNFFFFFFNPTLSYEAAFPSLTLQVIVRSDDPKDYFLQVKRFSLIGFNNYTMEAVSKAACIESLVKKNLFRGISNWNVQDHL